MPQLGFMEMLVVGVVALIVFGPQRLPDIARTVGRFLHQMRQMASDVRAEFEAGLDLDAVDEPVADEPEPGPVANEPVKAPVAEPEGIEPEVTEPVVESAVTAPLPKDPAVDPSPADPPDLGPIDPDPSDPDTGER